MIFERSSLLIGEENLKTLKNSHVAVFGVGGVGGFTVEALCRSGIGNITIFDADVVEESNVNRQIIAVKENFGKDKVTAFKKRLKSINPDINVKIEKVFYLPENADNYDFKEFDYVVDAVDTVSAKLEIIRRAKSFNIPVISCMGTAGKTDITSLKVSDIEKTSVCPLAKVMRRELKTLNIKDVKVIYSEEKPVSRKGDKSVGQPSLIFVPSVAGIMMAREVVMDLIKENK